MNPSSPRGPASTATKALRPLCVLLADDNEINQEAGQRILERRGHSVVLASTGLAVLDLLAKQHFDIVLMDCQMPEMDGFAATDRIREREKITGQHVPIVALTAHAMAGDRERCLAAGMDGYVSKPINRQELFDTIERLVPSSPNAANAIAPCGAPAAAWAVPAAAASATAPAATLQPATTLQPAALIDKAELMENLGDDHELLAQLAATFHATTPKLMNDLRAALSAGQHEAVKQWSHKMAGKFGVFYAHSAVTAARDLETIGKSGNLAAAPAAMATLEAQLAAVSAALKSMCG